MILGSESVRDLLVKKITSTEKINLQQLGPTLLDGRGPDIPERCRKQGEHGEAQGNVAERQAESGKAKKSNHPRLACSRRCGWSAAAAARSPHRSSAAAC